MTINLSALDSLPSYVGKSLSVLKVMGRRKGMNNLYDSMKWEHIHWNRGTQRCWKKQRRFRYHVIGI